MSPFLIQKGIVGTPMSVKKLTSGARLNEVTKKQYSTSLLDLKLLANVPVIGKVHIGLNQSKGIYFYRDHDLDGIPEEETKSELESQGVVSVTNTNTYLLTFGMPTLPTNIKIGVVSDEN